MYYLHEQLTCVEAGPSYENVVKSDVRTGAFCPLRCHLHVEPGTG